MSYNGNRQSWHIKETIFIHDKILAYKRFCHETKDRKCLLSTMGLMNKWTQNLWQNTQNVQSPKLHRAPAQRWSSGRRFPSLTWKPPVIYTHHQRESLFSLIEYHCSTVVGQHKINSRVFICMLVRGNFLFLFAYILVLWNIFKDRKRRESNLQ